MWNPYSQGVWGIMGTLTANLSGIPNFKANTNASTAVTFILVALPWNKMKTTLKTWNS